MPDTVSVNISVEQAVNERAQEGQSLEVLHADTLILMSVVTKGPRNMLRGYLQKQVYET